MDTSYALFILLLFVAVVLILEGAYLMWSAKHGAEAKKIARRLRSLDGHEETTTVSIERQVKKQKWSWLHGVVVNNLPNGGNLLHYLETSGTGRTITDMLVFTVLLGAGGYALPLVLGKPVIFSFLLAGIAASLPWFWLSKKRGERMKLFEKQLPEALDLMGRALRAGHSFPTAVKMVADEMHEPIGKEFRQLYDEENFGVPQHEALSRLAARVPLEDMRYFVIAVMIQRESGGNLAELLDNISSIIRARLKLMGEVRTLSAEGRLSAWILGLLPFAVALLVNLVNPKFMTVLWTDPVGLKLIGGALVMMTLGVVWMRKIIKIRV